MGPCELHMEQRDAVHANDRGRVISESQRGKEERMPTSADAPHEFRGGLNEVFRQRARELPARTAVEFGDESLTYQQLDSSSDRLAGWLTAQGVKSGDVIG